MAKKKNSQRPLIKFSESHDLSEMILICCFGVQEIFITIIINGKNYFFKDSLTNGQLRKTIYLKNLTNPKHFNNIYKYYINILPKSKIVIMSNPSLFWKSVRLSAFLVNINRVM